jgi:hypothetical protein
VKRSLILVCLLAACLASGGCAGLGNIFGGEAVNKTPEDGLYTDVALLYEANKEVMLAQLKERRPIFKVVAHEGQPITIQAKSIEINVPQGGLQTIRQADSGAVRIITSLGSGIIGAAAGAYNAKVARDMALGAFNAAGTRTEIHGLHQNISGGSAANVDLGGGDNSASGSQPATTTTTTEDNDTTTYEPGEG